MIKERIHLRIFNRIVGETFNEGTEHLADDSLESGLIHLKKLLLPIVFLFSFVQKDEIRKETLIVDSSTSSSPPFWTERVWISSFVNVNIYQYFRVFYKICES